MASLKTFFKNKDSFPSFAAKLDSSKLLTKQSDFVELAAKYIDVLIALEKADKASGNEATTLQRLEKVVSHNFITQTVGEIVADAVERRLSFLEAQIKETKSGKADKTGETNTVGSAYLRLDAHIKKMMAYNEGAKQKDRVYVSLSTSRKDNGNGIGKVRVNADAAKDYFTKNERFIINHNVDMGVFDESIKYLNNDQKAHALAIARDCGYEG